MKLLTATAVALILCSAPLLASADRGAVAPMMPAFDFATADADGDGAITRDEWTAYVSDLMQTRRAALFERRATQMIEAGDTDGDGLLSHEELATAFEARHDAFRDRMAERAEQRDAERTERRAERTERRAEGAERRAEGTRGERHAARGDRQGRGHGPHSHRQRMMSPDDFAERSFRRIDADSDGTISAEEFAAAQERWEQRPGRDRADKTD